MRNAAMEGDITTAYRYVDWILTVPLMCVEFYLILKPSGATKGMLWKLIGLSTLMLVTGYFGEAGVMGFDAQIWGLVSGLAYFAIVHEIYMGNAASLAKSAGGNVESAHKMLCKFVLIGWAIYPLGYMVGTADGMWYSFMGGLSLEMDLIYNVGDAINKIGFGLVVYNLAVSK
jgi:bacteriorhodopsin